MRQKSQMLPLILAAALSALIGCSHPPTQARDNQQDATVGQRMGDAVTTASVKMALALTRGVKASDINVSTRWGTVTLTGEVDSMAEKQLASKTTEDTDGVKRVVNKLEVRG